MVSFLLYYSQLTKWHFFTGGIIKRSRWVIWIFCMHVDLQDKDKSTFSLECGQASQDKPNFVKSDNMSPYEPLGNQMGSITLVIVFQNMTNCSDCLW